MIHWPGLASIATPSCGIAKPCSTSSEVTRNLTGTPLGSSARRLSTPCLGYVYVHAHCWPVTSTTIGFGGLSVVAVKKPNMPHATVDKREEGGDRQPRDRCVLDRLDVRRVLELVHRRSRACPWRGSSRGCSRRTPRRTSRPASQRREHRVGQVVEVAGRAARRGVDEREDDDVDDDPDDREHHPELDDAADVRNALLVGSGCR